MIRFSTVIQKFGQQGEKTGWTYILVPASLTRQLQPESGRSFRVKGKLDEVSIEAMALIPMGGGDFVLPLKADIRKKLGKRKGDLLLVAIEKDAKVLPFCPDLMACLADEPQAMVYFQQLTPSHRRYFSNWIESAKTRPTREKRIALAVNALSKKQGYPEMIRAQKNEQKES